MNGHAVQQTLPVLGPRPLHQHVPSRTERARPVKEEVALGKMGEWKDNRSDLGEIPLIEKSIVDSQTSVPNGWFKKKYVVFQKNPAHFKKISPI
ncbi:hypothetical protein [Geomonas anaerohicana]|uniref:Uncharacterized protein n=1 Tax=Geomonas anaerohicana TaxID=2798583 RepID=A0ABS0YIP1_9BACT|nr:hypothetical protein [Geomonas anaerohicana]MBJ6752199.1 hypothetical protein [Geomonas anaerohicana]